MFSTVAYVTEVIKQAPKTETNQYDMFPQYQQNLKHTLISSLANITIDNTTQVLSQNVDKLNQIFSSHFYESTLQIESTLVNTTPYQNGLWISGYQENHSIIGAQVSYQLESTGNTKKSNVVGIVNVTSEEFPDKYADKNVKSNIRVCIPPGAALGHGGITVQRDKP